VALAASDPHATAPHLLLAAGGAGPQAVQRSVDISCSPGPQQQTRSNGVWRPDGMDGQTDRRTQDSFIQLHYYAGSSSKYSMKNHTLDQEKT